MHRRLTGPLLVLAAAAGAGCVDARGLLPGDGAVARKDAVPALDRDAGGVDLGEPGDRPGADGGRPVADAAPPRDLAPLPAPDAAVAAPSAALDAAPSPAVVAPPAAPGAPPAAGLDASEQDASVDRPGTPPDAPEPPGPDAAWSPSDGALSPTETVLFQDDFESGGLSRWTTSAGSVSVDTACALEGSRGLRIGGAAAASVWFDLPSPQSHVKVSAKLDLTGFDAIGAAGAGPFLVLSTAAIPDVADVGFTVQAALPNDLVHASVRQAGGGSVPLQNDRGLLPGPHTVELEWRGSSGEGEPDGFIVLRVDGQPGIVQPSRADGLITVATAVTRLALGFAGGGSIGQACIDDVLLTSVP
jgi:hypothetical protein